MSHHEASDRPIDVWHNDGHYLEVYLRPAGQFGSDNGLDITVTCPFEDDPESLCQRGDLAVGRIDVDYLDSCWVKNTADFFHALWAAAEPVMITGRLSLEWCEIQDPKEAGMFNIRIRPAVTEPDGAADR